MGHSQRRSERGATLVEFAILLPLLILLLIGVAEFGWLYSQNLDVRHGAREAARLAATAELTAPQIVTETCNRMDSNGLVDISVGMTRAGADLGAAATVEVSATPSSLTGFLDPMLPHTLQSTVETRLEGTAAWNNLVPTTC